MTLDTLSRYKSMINRTQDTGNLYMKFYRMGAILKIAVEPQKRGLRPRLANCQVYIGLADVESSKGVLESKILSFKRNLNPKVSYSTIWSKMYGFAI